MCSLRLLPVLHMILQVNTSISLHRHDYLTKCLLILVDEVNVCTTVIGCYLWDFYYSITFPRDLVLPSGHGAEGGEKGRKSFPLRTALARPRGPAWALTAANPESGKAGGNRNPSWRSRSATGSCVTKRSIALVAKEAPRKAERQKIAVEGGGLVAPLPPPRH
ncbi:hypothetical protein KC349_g265 [Hortaea werneckii]|nr:hypothetical protein KC349_g265 [Hortaea werneckii]